MLETRKLPILIFVYSIGFIFLIRLFYLQNIDKNYRSIDALNSVRKVVSIPLRGQIYDREGKLIVANEEVYDMYITPKKVLPFDTVTFSSLFGVDKKYIDSIKNIASEYSIIRPSIFLRQLSKEEYASVIDAMVQYPGFHFEQSFFRTYPGNTLANALGYIGEIPNDQWANQETEYYRKGDYIGRSGLEKYYELDLRGTRGTKMVLMNSKGEEKGRFEDGKRDTTEVIGSNLYTYVDLGVQQLADSLFQGKVGAVVAIEPKTGGIIAIGSYPTYNPALLSGRNFSKNYSALTKDPDRPLNNRPISAFYRPGSTFKLVQAAIGLGDGVITPATSFTGAPSKLSVHSGGETANLYVAIQKSSNPYFDNVLRKIVHNNSETNAAKQVKLGIINWNKQIIKFGFGTQLGIDLPSETKGVIPNAESYDKTYGVGEWRYSTIYSISIGEGEYGVNVLKLANMAAVFANRGYWLTPHLVRNVGISPETGKKVPVVKHSTDIPSRHFEEVVKGMEMVVQSGTGRASQIKDVAVCGKTGTSQNAKGKDHAIFIAFAPKDDPKIAIAVVVENGGFGGVASAPIAGLLMEKFIKGKHGREAYKQQVMNTRYVTVAGRSASSIQ